MTAADAAVFRSWCVPAASLVRELRTTDVRHRISPTISIVVAPPAQSTVPFEHVRFECEIDPGSRNAVMEVLGSCEPSSHNPRRNTSNEMLESSRSGNKTGDM